MIDLCGAGSNFGLSEVAHSVAKGIYVFTELKVQAW
jgi:hypothetical protein